MSVRRMWGGDKKDDEKSNIEKEDGKELWGKKTLTFSSCYCQVFCHINDAIKWPSF